MIPMAPENLGTLIEVDVRSVWANEAQDFTPWLLENASRLAKALGIELELRQAEHPVGNFSLDLIGTDLTNNCELIVENQLTPTDHGHLGQLMTYAAGTNAQTIVWIATEFREEHREAIRWLNDVTGENARFFGIEVSVVKIGDSIPAPLFRLRAEPNEWGAIVAQQSAELSERELLYRKFWTLFLGRLKEAHPDWSNARKPGKTSWLTLPCPYTGCRWGVSFAANQRVMVELYIDSGELETNLAIYNLFLAAKGPIEHSFGAPLSWEDLPERRACRIAFYSDGHVTETEKHEAFATWMMESLGKLKSSLAAGMVDLSSID